VPFAVSVLDANGRRITPRHHNWLQLLPGDELECSGCHDPDNGLSHGRVDTFTSVYAGAPSTGVPFPNTDPAFFTDFGETMAETRSRISCITDCAALDPSVNVVYDDVWTDETAAGRPRDASFSYRYEDLDTPAPTTPECMQNWTSLCRIVINYEQHIHPLWSLPRLITDPMDPMVVLEDRTCARSGCHAPLDAMNAAQIPAAQLDLTDGPSLDDPNQFKAYRELLFDDDQNDITGQPILVPGFDDDGNPIFVTINVGSSMSAGGANASDEFFSMFDPGGTHAGDLTPAELRLIAEWVDIGAQYFNNPFDPAVPLN
jgi:hypothetical protein